MAGHLSWMVGEDSTQRIVFVLICALLAISGGLLYWSCNKAEPFLTAQTGVDLVRIKWTGLGIMILGLILFVMGCAAFAGV